MGGRSLPGRTVPGALALVSDRLTSTSFKDGCHVQGRQPCSTFVPAAEPLGPHSPNEQTVARLRLFDKACHTSCTIMTKDQGPCHNAITGCALGLACATQADGYWSQCISCEDDSFPYACPYWGPQLLAAAESACQKTCTSTK